MKVVHEGFLGCNECLNTFKSHKALENHKATHELMPCTKCGIAYNGKISLHAHMKRAHDTVEYMCDICSKVVRNNLMLREHKRKQHNDKSCKICFKTVSKMREHMLSLHTDDKQKPFQCDKCEKGFPSGEHLRNHQSSIHLKSRPYKCRYDCGMDYNDPSNMYQHEKRKHGGLFKRDIDDAEV